MRLASVHVRNFRCLRTVEVGIDDLTSLIGMNGAGKSAVLRAVAAFYSQGDLFTDQDWYGENSEEEIEVALTFSSLSPPQREDFARYISSDGTMKVARVWHFEGGKIREALHGFHLACSDFAPVRAADKGVTMLHNNLVDTGRFDGLRRAAKQDDVEDALVEWEAANPDRCEWIRDAGKFFGWNQVGGAKLAAATTCVYVPAVRDARDGAAQAKGSPLCLSCLRHLAPSN